MFEYNSVIPAQAGNQLNVQLSWIPACAGMTIKGGEDEELTPNHADCQSASAGIPVAVGRVNMVLANKPRVTIEFLNWHRSPGQEMPLGNCAKGHFLVG